MESWGSDSSLSLMDLRICSFTSRRSNLMFFWFWSLIEGVDVESVVKLGDDGRIKAIVVTGPAGVAVQGGLRGGGGGRGYGGDSGGYGGGGFSSGGYNGGVKWSNVAWGSDSSLSKMELRICSVTSRRSKSVVVVAAVVAAVVEAVDGILELFCWFQRLLLLIILFPCLAWSFGYGVSRRLSCNYVFF